MVIMSEKDARPIDVITRVIAGQVRAKEAAAIQGVSLRQVRRQIRAFRDKGAEGLIHGNRGRTSPRRIPDEVRRRVQALLREQYADQSTRGIRDRLASEQNIHLSYATVARLRAALGQASPHRRHAPERE